MVVHHCKACVGFLWIPPIVPKHLPACLWGAWGETREPRGKLDHKETMQNATKTATQARDQIRDHGAVRWAHFLLCHCVTPCGHFLDILIMLMSLDHPTGYQTFTCSETTVSCYQSCWEHIWWGCLSWILAAFYCMKLTQDTRAKHFSHN